MLRDLERRLSTPPGALLFEACGGAWVGGDHRPRVVQAQRLKHEVDRRGQHEEVRVLPEQPHRARRVLQAVLHLVRVRVRVGSRLGLGLGVRLRLKLSMP